MTGPSTELTPLTRARFQRDGYVVQRALADDGMCESMLRIAREHLADTLAPVEYEADVKYPGAPADRDAEGGSTVRRLLDACARHPLYREWATSIPVRSTLSQLFGTGEVTLSQCHHNCIMTKQPGFSSATLWHQDNRYWSFDEENLISVWVALGTENRDNGCLRVIPGSHAMNIEPGRFDARQFLRPDLPENKELIARSALVELNKGDVLFFHSRLFHAAGRNLTDETKFSVVFTYHEASNHPIEATRSARYPGIPL
ncbi:MAG: phytanoyl-CoA dioxygenase family protein [Pseudomonadales bacterium]|nr:phytanoyl-CoA dioxygenase family protein [Pseudomonadales bacterium]